MNLQNNHPLVISVIINSGRQLDIFACLDSLLSNSYPNHKVIVLDYHTSDESIDEIRNTYSQIEIIKMKQNLGYAGNNNVGLESALEQGAAWILILNDDVVLDPECLVEMVNIGEADPAIGVVGPLVYHHDEPKIIQSAGGMLGRLWQSIHLGKNELDKGQFDRPYAVEWISGCAIMVRKDAVEQAGMFDQNYFMYWEDTEWCIRVAQAGWKILMAPHARIWHKGVQRNYQPQPSFSYYGTRNHLLTLAKHKAPLFVRIHTLLQIIRTLVSWSIRPKWKHRREHRNALWKGVVDFFKHRWGQISE